MAECSLTSPKSPADFLQAANVFKALSNPNRLLIIHALSQANHCVADLTTLVGLDMSTVSNHLAVLRQVGLIVSERRGTQIFYSLRTPCIMNVFCCLEEFEGSADN